MALIRNESVEHIDEDSKKMSGSKRRRDVDGEEEEEEKEEYLSEEDETFYPEMDSSSFYTDDGSPLKRAKYNVNWYKQGQEVPCLEKQTVKDTLKDQVLPYLPAKILARFRSVSKDWNNWIMSPFFALGQSRCFRNLSGFFCQYGSKRTIEFMPLDRPAYGVPCSALEFLPAPVNIKSSSGGLLLCEDRDDNVYYICNPAIKKWKMLDKPELYHGPGSSVVLAFEPSLLNIEAAYQVICAVPVVGESIVFFEVYSSKTQKWTESTTVCVEIRNSGFTGDGFYLNGKAYWLTTNRKILAFDAMNEMYEIISLPSDSPEGGVLTKVNDEIFYAAKSVNIDKTYLSIYRGKDFELKSEISLEMLVGKVERSWRYRILPSAEDGVVMIFVGKLVYSCGLIDEKIELVSREGFGYAYDWTRDKYLPYVNTLASLS